MSDNNNVRMAELNTHGDILITVDKILTSIADDPEDQYTAKLARKMVGDGKTALEILNFQIPDVDKIWLLTRPGVLPAAIMSEYERRRYQYESAIREKYYNNTYSCSMVAHEIVGKKGRQRMIEILRELLTERYETEGGTYPNVRI